MDPTEPTTINSGDGTGREPADGQVAEIPAAFGRYRVVGELGHGAMGSVYLARDSQLGRQVALKIPRLTEEEDEELLTRFHREARLAARVSHPNIRPVYDVGEVGGRPFMAMAYIKGRSLKDYARSKRTQPERQVAQVVRKLALALAEAHAIGIVHRDLKPANVMIDERGEPIVMDWA